MVKRESLTPDEWVRLRQFIGEVAIAYGGAARALDADDLDGFLKAAIAVDDDLITDGMQIFMRLVRVHAGQEAVEQVADKINASVRFDSEKAS